jgi:hypothetical protein
MTFKQLMILILHQSPSHLRRRVVKVLGTVGVQMDRPAGRQGGGQRLLRDEQQVGVLRELAVMAMVTVDGDGDGDGNK